MRRIPKLIPWPVADRSARGPGVHADGRSRRVPGSRRRPGPAGRLAGEIASPSVAVLALAVLGALGVVLGQWGRKMRRRAAARNDALLRRDRILEAVGTGAERLLRLANASRLNAFLALLGEATGATRVYIFQNHRDEHGEFVASQRFEWVAPGVVPQIDNPDLQGASYEAWGMQRWRAVLSRGRAILGSVDEFPAAERALLKEQNIRSLVVIPIFVGPEWWGFIGFDEIRWERWWSPAEVDALRTSAGLIAAAIERDRADERMQQLERTRAERGIARAAERRSRFLAEASRVLGSTLQCEAIYEQLARLVVPELGDWCVIDAFEDDVVRRVAVTHADPGKAALAARILRSAPPRDRTNPIAQAVESGTARSIPRITDEMIAEHLPAGDGELGPRAAMVVPLRARGRVLGVMTLLAAESGRYRPDDLALADEVAGRASLGLENARLYTEAQRATRSRDEMLAVVSHDLRDPLNTISLSLGVLEQMAPLDEEASRRQLEIIGRSVQRADRLIRDLLDVARLESGRLRLETRRVSSVEVAREAIELHRSQAAARGQRLVGEVPEDLSEVQADRDRLLQVFGNLLGNAIKFTPEGGRITLGAEPTEAGVRFRVTDTGRGIPADQLPHLFDPFWQATRRGEGAGLGLAIARGIVEAHGGCIRAESEVGVGTTISFSIPTAEDEERPGVEAPSRNEPAGRRRP